MGGYVLLNIVKSMNDGVAQVFILLVLLVDLNDYNNKMQEFYLRHI